MTKTPDDPLDDMFGSPDYPGYKYNQDISFTENVRRACEVGADYVLEFLKPDNKKIKEKDVKAELGPLLVFAMNGTIQQHIHNLKNKNVAPFTHTYRDVLRDEYQTPYGNANAYYVDQGALDQLELTATSHYGGDCMRAVRQFIGETKRLKRPPDDINKWLMGWCLKHQKPSASIL